MNTDALVGDIVGHWLKYGERRRTICFAVGVGHSAHIKNEFEQFGVRAEHLDFPGGIHERSKWNELAPLILQKRLGRLDQSADRRPEWRLWGRGGVDHCDAADRRLDRHRQRPGAGRSLAQATAPDLKTRGASRA